MPLRLQSDVKKWSTFLLDPFLEKPPPPPIKVHSGKGHLALAPPPGEVLPDNCPPPGSASDLPASSKTTTKKSKTNEATCSQSAPSISKGTNKDQPAGTADRKVNVWQYVLDTVPFLDNMFLSPPKDAEIGKYVKETDNFYLPSPEEIASPDLRKLFHYIQEDENNRVLLSRPIIDEENDVYVRQFGVMGMPAGQDLTDFVFVRMRWFEGDFQDKGLQLGENLTFVILMKVIK